MEKLEQLELIEVTQDLDKTVFTFLDRERGEVRDITWNTKKYDSDTNKWTASTETMERVEGWAKDYFDCTYPELANLADKDVKKDVYAYDKFNSLWEASQVAKFSKEDVGQIFSVTVTDVVEEVSGLKIKFDYDGETYQSNMGWAKFIEATKEWFSDPIKKSKQQAKFEEKFGIPFENKVELIGKDVMVEVSLAFGTAVYAEIKPFPKKKK